MKREQIIKIMQKGFEEMACREASKSELNYFKESADAILALPLEVPSDEECQQHMTAMNFFQHKDEFDYDVWDEGKLHWAIQGYKIASKWMRDEIIKRNK